MKVLCKKDDLLYGFQLVQNISSSRTTLPILGNVLISARGENITLTATDLEVGIQVKVPCKIEEEGTTTLPAKKMFNLIKELSSSDLQINVESNHIANIHCGTSDFKIIGMPETDFPKLPSFEKKKGFVLDQKIFKDLICKTAYAISKDETRYVLNGLCLSFYEDKVVLIATDGRRLALAQASGKFTGGEKEIILPSKAVSEISKILKEQGQIEIIPFENQVAFVFRDDDLKDGCVIISRLVEGNFPNYKQIIPEKIKERAVFDREEFFSAVRRVSVVTNEKSNLMKLSFTKNLLTLTANTPDVGEGREEIPLAYEGTEQTIAFNPGYLSDPLRNLEDKEITFEFSDSLSPGVIRTGSSFLYVIMPMRIA